MENHEQPFRVRQLWAHTTSPTPTLQPNCTPVTLPKNGIVSLDSELAVTLTQPAVFFPECTGDDFLRQICTDNSVSDPREPFYASTSPQIYALASCTVIAYLLAIMLFITPRTFFVGGQGGGARFLGSRGIMGGSFGNPSIVSVGRRPWLQKLAALSVAASLTIASADTFRIAERQYDTGYTDSSGLVNEVAASLEIRIVRVISTTFLWLAQVQTLIRLFPRHKEKVVIKWLGFALIVLDTVFSILDNFVHQGSRMKPRSFQDAIPALSYLFELSISFIYASCVIYYALSKRRFAFFHLKMRNMFLVAIMALTAVLIPIVFFVLDVSKPNVAGWGDYVRWVGSAAASVVVWEWVERIEALERDERKDGILGREIFDGDDMLEVTPSEEVDWHGKGGDYKKSEDGIQASGRADEHHRRTLRSRFRAHAVNGFGRHGHLISRFIPHATGPTPPPPAITPVSRAETQSAASTVYAIRYHPVASTLLSGPTAIPGSSIPRETSESSINAQHIRQGGSSGQSQEDHLGGRDSSNNNNFLSTSAGQAQQMWRSMPNPFKRRRGSPPAEVAGAQRAELHTSNSQSSLRSTTSIKGKSIRERMERLKEMQNAKARDKNKAQNAKASLPVTVIPARSKGQRTWSPEDLELGRASLEPGSSQNTTLQQPISQDSIREPVVTLMSTPRRLQIGVAHSSPPETTASETLSRRNEDQNSLDPLPSSKNATTTSSIITTGTVPSSEAASDPRSSSSSAQTISTQTPLSSSKNERPRQSDAAHEDGTFQRGVISTPSPPKLELGSPNPETRTRSAEEVKTTVEAPSAREPAESSSSNTRSLNADGIASSNPVPKNTPPEDSTTPSKPLPDIPKGSG